MRTQTPTPFNLSLLLSPPLLTFLLLSWQVCSDVDKQLIFDEIIPSAHLLMTDVFGNYVLQKLFEVRNIPMRMITLTTQSA